MKSIAMAVFDRKHN